jgi:hypothetical protein
VSLHVRNARFDARVVHVRGVETVLSLPRGVPAAARPLPAEAELTFQHDRQLVMLSGILRAGDEVSARFQIDDGIAPRELRRFVRLAVGLPVIVTQVSADGMDTGSPEVMKTVDISAGGVLVDRTDLRGFVRVELELPGGHGTIVATGRVVRNVRDGSGVRFDQIEREQQELLDSFVVGVRHQLAQRFAQSR